MIQRSFPNRGFLWLFPRWNKIFQSYPTKERKIFQHKIIDQIDRFLCYHFFRFDILKLTYTFITGNWGEREDTQKVLVAICTLEYFSWLYTFIFFRCFSFFSSSLEPLFFQCSYRTYFFRSSYRSWKNILYREMKLILLIQVLPQTTIKRYLKLQSQYWIVAT